MKNWGSQIFLCVSIASLVGCSIPLGVPQAEKHRRPDLTVKDVARVTRTKDVAEVCVVLHSPVINRDFPFTLNVPLTQRDRWIVRELPAATKVRKTMITFDPTFADLSPGCATDKQALALIRIKQDQIPERVRKSKDGRPVQLEPGLSEVAYVVTNYLSVVNYVGYVSNKPLEGISPELHVWISPGLEDKLRECGKLLMLDDWTAGGKDVNAKDDSEWTALHCAARENDETRARWLVQNKAQIDARTDKEATPLFIAAGLGSAKVVKVLIESKADVNAVSALGGTPLLAASRSGHAEVVRMLLDRGANVHYVDPLGNTAWKWADRNQHAEVKALLERHGCCNR